VPLKENLSCVLTDDLIHFSSVLLQHNGACYIEKNVKSFQTADKCVQNVIRTQNT